MMDCQVQGLRCPHCGVVFFADDVGLYGRCPVCQAQIGTTSCELLEATLEVE